MTFECDGDGGDAPAQRWGVWCMLMPKGVAEPKSQEDFDNLACKILSIESSAKGVSGQPEVQREGWDETRLRALCARHGWDFEWMAEDGEGRRRARERLALVECPAVRPTAPDPSMPDGAGGLLP